MKKYILILAVFFTAGISGCKKDYLSLEVNPNAPSVTTPQLTLAGALVTTRRQSLRLIIRNMGFGPAIGPPAVTTCLTRLLTNTSLPMQVFVQWPVEQSVFNLTNYNNLQQLAAQDPSLAIYQAIAMIMKAYGFQQLVDDYNDIPYQPGFPAVNHPVPCL